MPTKGEQLKSILQLLGTSVTKAEVEDAFKTVVKYVQDLKTSNSQEFALIKTAVSMLGDKLKEANTADIAGHKQDLTKTIQKALQEQEKGMKFIYDKVSKLKSGRNGIDAAPIDEDALSERILGRVKIPDKAIDPYEIRDALSSLPEGDRLDATALKGYRLTPDDQKVTRVVGNHGPLSMLIDVNVTGLVTGQVLQWNGTQWVPVTISGSGTGFQAPTGTVNGTNAVFVFASAPSAVCVDGGRAMQKTSSDGTVNWTGTTTITLTVAPTFDIFGVA